MARAIFDLALGHPIEHEDHFQVREAVQPCQRFRPEARRIELDAGAALAPVVVDRLIAATVHVPYRLDCDHVSGCPTWPDPPGVSSP